MAFAGNFFAFKIHNHYTQNIFFSGNEIIEDLLQFKNWLFGIIGGTIAGFHLLMIFILENAFKNGSTTILMEKRKNRTNVIAEFYGEHRNKISAISPKKIGEIADKISISLRFFCDDG